MVELILHKIAVRLAVLLQSKIRGQNSLRADGNQPLYIIDGVPIHQKP
jgi:hypothetical protein